MKQYIALLRQERVVRRLSLIQLISYFGAWFSNVAIYTLLIQIDVDASVVAFVAMLHFIAGVVQTPFSGVVIDRMSPRKLMLMLIAVEMISTFLLVLVNSHDDLLLLYLLIFLKMAAASFYFTTEMSLLPKILEGKDLQIANEIHSIIWSLSYTTGMALSGFVVYSFGIKAAFIIDGFMFVSAFVLLANLQLQVEMIEMQEGFFSMIKDTFVYLKKSPLALHLMLIHAFVGFSAFDALVALMVDSFYASVIATSLGLGLLHASRAVGLVVGPMVLGKFLNNKRLVYIFYAQAGAIFLWAYVMEDFYLSLAASVVVGFFTTTLWSYSYTLLQKNIEERYYGRVVAYNDMLFLSTAAFVSFMIGQLASYGMGLQMIAVMLGVGFIVGGVYFALIIKYRNLREIEG